MDDAQKPAFAGRAFVPANGEPPQGIGSNQPGFYDPEA